MGNVCATKRGVKQGVLDTFPTDDEVTSDSDEFDDIMFRDYMEGKHELVENMATRGSSFLKKKSELQMGNVCATKRGVFDTFPTDDEVTEVSFRDTRGSSFLNKKSELHVEIPSPTDYRMPSPSTGRSSDQYFEFGFRIQNPRPMPLCFTGPRTPPGSPRCFDSDCRSQFSDSNTPPSSDFESSFQSTPPRSQPHTPSKLNFSMSSDEDQGNPAFDKSIWIWPAEDTIPREPPKLKLKEVAKRDKVWPPPSPRHPQFTPLVYRKTHHKTTREG